MITPDTDSYLDVQTHAVDNLLMPRRLLICVFSLLLTSLVALSQSRAGFGNGQVNGDYVGIQKDPSLSPDEPGVKWFHENTLVVRNNEAILDKIPFTVEHGKKSYSASDGGFTTYRGRFFQKDGQISVYLRMFESDYIAFPIGGCEPYSKISVFPVTFLPNGIRIEGVVYKNKMLSANTRERILTMLNKERMEYTGEHPYNDNLHAPVCNNSTEVLAPSDVHKQK